MDAPDCWALSDSEGELQGLWGQQQLFRTHTSTMGRPDTCHGPCIEGCGPGPQPYFCILLQASCKAGGTQEGAGIIPGPTSYTPGSRPEEESAVCPGPRGQQAWE